MYKLIFDIITSPMGLPVEWYYQYIILSLVGELAYRIAFNRVGILKAEGYIYSSEEAKFFHWIIRLLVYVTLCVICRVVIAIFRLLLK